jgi:hypothetical protein
MRYFFALCVSAILCTSCEKIIDIDLDHNPNLLVVEGLIGNLSEFYYVSLRYSTSYSFSDSTDISQPAIGAQVAIKDDLGNIARLSEWGPTLGVYRTDSLSPFRGTPGRSYYVDIITTDGKHYVSRPEIMRQPVPIDRLYSIYEPAEKGIPGVYKVFIDFTDPVGKGNCYRWLTQLDIFNMVNVDIDNDQFTDGKAITGRQLVGLQSFQPGLDTLSVVVRQASLTPEAYEFWEIFLEQYESQENAPYDIPPSPLIGNVYNVNDPDDYALGYFSVASMSQKKIVLRK